MSEFALRRIEQALGKLSDQQAQIWERISGMEERLAKLGSGAKLDRQRLLDFLDKFRAGESLGEATLGAWIAVSDTACLRGGLRTAQRREGMHAQLLEERLCELGGEPRHEVPAAEREKMLKDYASTEKTDAQKLFDFVERFPDIEVALKPIHDIADQLDDDQETQFLLRTIAQDERSTLQFLTDACALLNS